MDPTTQTAFIVLAAAILVSVLIQAVAAVALLVAAGKMQKKIHALTEDLRASILPVVSSSRVLIEDLSPRLKLIASNLVEASASLSKSADQVGMTVADVAGRTRAQASRIEDMVAGTLDQVVSATDALQEGVAATNRRVNGILNGLRVGIGVLLRGSPAGRNGLDDDLFV